MVEQVDLPVEVGGQRGQHGGVGRLRHALQVCLGNGGRRRSIGRGRRSNRRRLWLGGPGQRGHALGAAVCLTGNGFRDQAGKRARHQAARASPGGGVGVTDRGLAGGCGGGCGVAVCTRSRSVCTRGIGGTRGLVAMGVNTRRVCHGGRRGGGEFSWALIQGHALVHGAQHLGLLRVECDFVHQLQVGDDLATCCAIAVRCAVACNSDVPVPSVPRLR